MKLNNLPPRTGSKRTEKAPEKIKPLKANSS